MLSVGNWSAFFNLREFLLNYTFRDLQARSQDLEKGGGAILKECEKCKRPWPEFSLFLNEFHTVCPKIETKFLGKLGNSKVFPPKIRWSPKKKKKKKRSSLKLRLIFPPKSEIQSFFPPKNRWSPKTKKKTKKKVFAEIETDLLKLIFRLILKIQTFEGGLFSYGRGLFSIFHKKSASKAPKTYNFAYFTSQWWSSSPPRPPGYATGDLTK